MSIALTIVAVVTAVFAGRPGAADREPGASEGCTGAWVRARLDAGGTYTLTNSRNGFSKTYQVK